MQRELHEGYREAPAFGERLLGALHVCVVFGRQRNSVPNPPVDPAAFQYDESSRATAMISFPK